MRLELFIDGELKACWPLEDFQPGFGELVHEARAQCIQDIISEIKKDDRICAMLYECSQWEFLLNIKSRARMPEYDTDLLTEKI